MSLTLSKRVGDDRKKFVKRTVAAQIHTLGAIAALAGMTSLAAVAYHRGFSHFAATLAFGITGLLVFSVSSIYHFLNDGYECSPRLVIILEKLDHTAIYLFIAGTYTPFLLNTISEPWKTPLIVAVWAIAILGICYTSFKEKFPKWAQHRMVYTSIFVAMGWLLAVRMAEVIHFLPRTSLFMLAAGGLSYTVGAVIYATKRPKLFVGVFGFHELWHVLVLMGFLFHYELISSFYRS